jgi:hypothetical protein
MPPGGVSPNQSAEVPGAAGGYRNAPVSAPTQELLIPPVPAIPGNTGTLVVDLGALAAAVKVAEIAAARAQHLADDVEATAQRSGPAPWGDDPGLGQAFGDAFAESRITLVQTVRELPVLLHGLADSLDATRRGFADAEDAALSSAGDLARRFSDLAGGSS